MASTKTPANAPSDLGLQSTGDEEVDAALMNAAEAYNIPPAVMFATAQTESGLNPTAVGDQGTSFGLFQEHEGGELTSVASAENPVYAANLAAQTFASARAQDPNATWGQIVAAAQRPKNQQSYAADVNAQLGPAGNLPAAQAQKALGSTVSSSLMTPGAAQNSPVVDAELASIVTGGPNVGISAGGGTSTGGSSLYDLVTQALGSSSQSENLGGYVLGQAAPGIAQQQLAESQALEQAGLSPATIQEGAANLTSNAGYDIASALANVQGLQLQGQSLATSIGTAAQQQTYEQGEYQNQLQQLGLTSQELGSQQQYIGGEQQLASSQYGVQQAQLANQSAQIAYEYPLQMQQQQGAAAAAGASNTVGNQQAQAELTAFNGGQGFQQQALGLQGQQAALSEQGTQAGYSQQLAQLGFSQQSNTYAQQLAGLQQSSELSGYQGQQKQYANSQQQLTLAAQQAGIPAQQAYTQLQYGLGQLGISADPTSFLSQAAGAQGNISQDYAAAISAASVIGGLGPSTFSSSGKS